MICLSNTPSGLGAFDCRLGEMTERINELGRGVARNQYNARFGQKFDAFDGQEKRGRVLVDASLTLSSRVMCVIMPVLPAGILTSTKPPLENAPSVAVLAVKRWRTS